MIWCNWILWPGNNHPASTSKASLILDFTFPFNIYKMQCVYLALFSLKLNPELPCYNAILRQLFYKMTFFLKLYIHGIQTKYILPVTYSAPEAGKLRLSSVRASIGRSLRGKLVHFPLHLCSVKCHICQRCTGLWALWPGRCSEWPTSQLVNDQILKPSDCLMVHKCSIPANKLVDDGERHKEYIVKNMVWRSTQSWIDYEYRFSYLTYIYIYNLMMKVV